MAWVFEKSPTWRKIVGITKRSPLAMAGFTAVCFGGPYALAKLTMNATNPELQKEEAQKMLSKASLHQKAMSRVNKERLAILLEETRQGSGSERYAAALRGESMGTHKGGTTLGARGYTGGNKGEAKDKG